MSSVISQIRKIGPLAVMAVITGILMAAPAGMAADSRHSRNRLRTITPMTEMSSYNPDANAADYFDLIGILNSIDGNQVTIGDRQLTLAPGVGTTGMSQFNTVGANLNRAGEVVVLVLVADEPN